VRCLRRMYSGRSVIVAGQSLVGFWWLLRNCKLLVISLHNASGHETHRGFIIIRFYLQHGEVLGGFGNMRVSELMGCGILTLRAVCFVAAGLCGQGGVMLSVYTIVEAFRLARGCIGAWGRELS